MKIVINPEFSALKDFVYQLPCLFEKKGKSIYKARNEIKVFNVNGIDINVKKYRVPIFINKIAYTFFRKPKATRAYQNALKVIEKGLDTPAPIGYIIVKKCGLISESYFISIQCPYERRFTEFRENLDITGKERILDATGKYIAKMHENNILHLDLSIGNILFEDRDGKVSFSLVDLNRMKFCNIDMELGCKNFQRLRGSDEFFTLLGKSYAQARGFDEEKCIKLILKYNAEHIHDFERHKKMKKKIKRK